MRGRPMCIHKAMSFLRCTSSLYFAALLLLAVTVFHPTRAPAQQRPVFGASVERVRVDVIVTDGDGRFVDDLDFADFLVFEDGAPQQVLDVQLVDLGVGTVADIQPLPAAEESLPLPSEGAPLPAPTEGVLPPVSPGEYAAAPPTRPVGDTYGAMIYLIDGSGLEPGARIRFARQWGEMLGETESFSVPRAVYMFDTAGVLSELSPLTNDVDALRRVAEEVERLPSLGTSMQKKLVGLLNESLDPATEKNAIVRARGYEDEELVRSFRSLERLTQFCDALAARPGRTALVWVSMGVKLTVGGPYSAVAGNDPAELVKRDPRILKRQEALHEAANSANVSIYSIDPSLPGASQSVQFDVESAGGGSDWLNEEYEALEELDRANEMEGAVSDLRDSLRLAATATGGEAFIQAGDAEVVLGRIEEDGRRYYLLTYAVPPPLGDDEYHDIRVEVQRSGVDVRARGGYVDLAPIDRRTRSVAAALMVPGAVATTPAAIGAFRMWSAEGRPVVDLSVAVESVDEADKRAGDGAEGGSGGPGAGSGSGSRARSGADSGAGTTAPWKELHAMALSDDNEIVDEFHIEVERPSASPSGDDQPATPGAAASRPFVYVHTWELPPGDHDIRVVVTDAATGQLSAAQLRLEVPKPSKEWTISDLMLTVSDGSSPFQPLLDNEVTPGDRLEIYVEVFGGKGPAISGLVFGSHPDHPLAELARLTLPRGSAGIHRGAMWLEGIPPGRYTLKIKVTDDAAGREREFEFPLVSRSSLRGRR